MDAETLIEPLLMGSDDPFKSKEKGHLVSQTAFPVLRQLHIDGRFQDFCTGGLSPSRILLGCRCVSGQSRTVARTVAMVSHLRKMRRLSSDLPKGASALHKYPRCSQAGAAMPNGELGSKRRWRDQRGRCKHGEGTRFGRRRCVLQTGTGKGPP
jgi:hypothetical protein